MAPGKKIDLKDKVEDGEIDLSMLSLEEVPVKEIASVKKAYSLDLSNNHLTYLPNNFSTLTNLTKIDLSKNKLKELPENFGNLEKLIHLDLYKNELQHLPLSFHRLRNLKWLDLKDNALVPAIAKVAGPCLDNKQCHSCARDIVQFYIQMNEKITQERESREAQRQKDLQQKAKLEKKKKDKKDKIKHKDGNDNLQKDNKNEDTCKVETKNVNLQENLDVKRKKSLVVFILWSIFAFSFTSFLVLFLATSVKTKGLQNVEQYINTTWITLRHSLPPPVDDYIIIFENSFKTFHSFVGEKIMELTEVIARLSHSAQIKMVQEYVLPAYDVLRQKVNETYHKFL